METSCLAAKPTIGEGKGEYLRDEVREIYQTLEEVPPETHQQLGQFHRKDEVDRRFAKIDSELNFLTVTLRNSKISHLAQKIHALPAYDAVTQQPLPIPEYFPSRALAFYRLQDEKHRTSFLCAFLWGVIGTNGMHREEAKRSSQVLST